MDISHIKHTEYSETLVIRNSEPHSKVTEVVLRKEGFTGQGVPWS